MTREDLYDVLRKKGLSLSTSKKIVDMFFDEIKKGLKENKKVLLKNFASFYVKEKKEIKIKDNIQKKERVIPSHKVVLAKFSRHLKEQILNNKGNL